MLNWYSLFKFASEDDEMYASFGDPKEWNLNQLALLEHSNLYDISVVQVVSFEDVPANNGDYEMKNANETYWHNPFGGILYKRNEVVPIKTIKPYGFHAERNEGYRYVGAQNLSRTLDDLVRKNMKVVYPDLIVKFWNSEQYSNIVKDFPQLKEKKSVLDQIDYQTFDVNGHTVLVLVDQRAKKEQDEQKAYGYVNNTGIYYWYLPEYKLRSINLPSSASDPKTQNLYNQIRSPLGYFRYVTVQEALHGAEKYLDYMFPENVDQVEPSTPPQGSV